MDFLSESKARGEGNVDLGFDFDASQWAGWNRKKKKKKKADSWWRSQEGVTVSLYCQTREQLEAAGT